MEAMPTSNPEHRLLTIAEHIRSYSAAEGRLTHEMAQQSEISHEASRRTPPSPPHVAASAFDEMISAVAFVHTTPLHERGTLAPPSRYMVRVARVEKPHRTTKRNYDYFEMLNAALAAEELEHSPQSS